MCVCGSPFTLLLRLFADNGITSTFYFRKTRKNIVTNYDKRYDRQRRANRQTAVAGKERQAGTGERADR